MLSQPQTFNRTIVELKHSNDQTQGLSLPTFNRTIVELKRIHHCYRRLPRHPLIEPLWN